MERVHEVAGPYDLLRTLASLRHATGDPSHRVVEGALWRASRTPDGPVSYRLVQHGAVVRASAWGPGAAWLLDGLPELLGADLPFASSHALLARARARHPGLRIPRTRRVFESLVPAVLEQKVTGVEARAAWSLLMRRYGEPAPGPVPAGLRVPPAPQTWRLVPSWEWHRAGVDPRRMRTVLAAAAVAGRLEELVGMDRLAALDRLTAVPGIGRWTAAEVAVRALGDTDAVSVGDYHLPALVGWSLVGKPVDDDGMLELLEQYRPHRALAMRLIELAGDKPRFGPRMTVQDHRRH